MHAQWPYTDCLHAYSDLYTLYTSNPCVCVCVRFIETCIALYVQSLSLRKVSSTEGSGSTMSGSLSMLRPSRLRGSMCSSSSNGKPPSVSKHSGTIQSALLMSFDRLGLESSEREKQMMVGECFLPSGKHFLLLQLTVPLPSSWGLKAILFKAIWHCQIFKKHFEPEETRAWGNTDTSQQLHERMFIFLLEKCQHAMLDSWKTSCSADTRKLKDTFFSLWRQFMLFLQSDEFKNKIFIYISMKWYTPNKYWRP